MLIIVVQNAGSVKVLYVMIGDGMSIGALHPVSSTMSTDVKSSALYGLSRTTTVSNEHFQAETEY